MRIDKARRPVPASQLIKVPTGLYPGAFFTVHPDDPRARKGAAPVENKAAPEADNKAAAPAKGKRRPKEETES